MGVCRICLFLQYIPKGTEGVARPLSFLSTSFKETEQQCSKWEKGLLSLARAVKEAEGLYTSQDSVAQLSLCQGTTPPWRVAQKATVWKWMPTSKELVSYCN